jgi:predicted SAM-dependent methyltransferase
MQSPALVSMSHEASKAALRRLHDPAFMARYMVGHALDVGAGEDGLSKQMHLWPLLRSVRDWDVGDGDAQTLDGVPDGSFDLVHSSHSLEHMRGVVGALDRWLDVTKPGGHVVVLVPDEDMYEQGQYPSTFNPDHKHPPSRRTKTNRGPTERESD